MDMVVSMMSREENEQLLVYVHVRRARFPQLPWSEDLLFEPSLVLSIEAGKPKKWLYVQGLKRPRTKSVSKTCVNHTSRAELWHSSERNEMVDERRSRGSHLS